MRRYRFGRIAALLATAYVLAAVAFGVIALATGDPGLLRRLAVGTWGSGSVPFTWWVELGLVAGAVLQGWAYWQVLRGRLAGEPGSRERQVRLLRAALYLGIACTLLFWLPIPYQWWFGLLDGVIQLAVVWLFFVVLAGVLPRWLRLIGLVAGLLDVAIRLVSTVALTLEPLPHLLEFLWRLPFGAIYLLWLVPILVGQARDPRWSPATVRMGVISASLTFVTPSSYSYVTIGGDVDHTVEVLYTLLGVLGVFGTVWQARSAHELAGPPPLPSPARVMPARAAARPWPPAAMAVAFPLIPAAVNLAHGMPMWIGPRGAVDNFFREYTSYPAGLLWLAVDVLVGVGAPAVLVLVAVVRRTRRLLRGTMAALTLAAAAGVGSALTHRPDPYSDLYSELPGDRLAGHQDGLVAEGFGLSPLWYSAALAASALVLLFLYGAPPAARLRHHVLVTALATSVALCFLPVADQSRGPVTTAEECSPPEPWEMREEAEPRPLTGPRAFICAVREHEVLKLPATTPDQVLLAHGRRLCGAHTRDDPRELTRLQAVEGVSVRGMDWALAGICPSADSAVKARKAAQEREFAAFDAEEQRKCDATPHHQPLIKPARSIRLKEPEWPEAGLQLFEPTEDGDLAGDEFDTGLVSGGPGHLVVGTSSDYHICVTLETYKRRPPVETKGWQHVVEVGHDSPTGKIVFTDGLSGTQLPDLSLNGRKGHYRIRVHFAWFPWNGDEYGTQRLLIMAYPAPGDKAVTYRKPAAQR
ncbi:hypothetical protein [Nonomuraea sp. LPB2021202275-12-8]|uniref:hypothetical protein n=1 Tax=Nonomuraea sp. LPB2021202275-12-8 TaxID=3120159 RepID=UPI00300DA87A